MANEIRAFRVFKHRDGEDSWYDILDVVHSESGAPIRIDGIHPVSPMGNSIDQLREDLRNIMAALDKPVLSEQDFIETVTEIRDADQVEEDQVCGCGCEEEERESVDPKQEAPGSEGT